MQVKRFLPRHTNDSASSSWSPWVLLKRARPAWLLFFGAGMNQQRVNSRRLVLLCSLCRCKLHEHIHHILRMHPRFAFVPLVITGWLGLKGRNQRFPTKPVSWSQQFPAASGALRGHPGLHRGQPGRANAECGKQSGFTSPPGVSAKLAGLWHRCCQRSCLKPCLS